MTAVTAWAHLPNAKHIDRVLADVKTNPAKWGAAWDAARDAARYAARYAARDAARGAARDAAWGAAWGAAISLIAWDDCAGLLDLHPDALRLLASQDHHPAALLLPACIALTTKESP